MMIPPIDRAIINTVLAKLLPARFSRALIMKLIHMNHVNPIITPFHHSIKVIIL
jgi:hypothetical protein